MCTSPITVKQDNSNGVHYISVPCGKCCECKKQYQNDWCIRLFEESKNWSKACFFTLTYNDDTVPYTMTSVDYNTGEVFDKPVYAYDGLGKDGLIRTVYKKDVQDWFKRFRENYELSNGCRVQCKYFITSEYGPRTLRPHYHGIIFGLSYSDFILALHDWRKRYGFYTCSDIDLLNSDSKLNACRYVSKYCSKGFFENPRVARGTVRPTFHLISKGIGKSYISLMKNYHLARHIFKFDSRIADFGKMLFKPKYLEFVVSLKNYRFPNSDIKYHLPRYYSNAIFTPKSALSHQIADFIFRRNCEVRDERARQVQAEYPSWSFDEALGFIYMQENIALSAREQSSRASLARFYDKSKL